MDLKQLEYFVNVVDLGGFSRAARVLGIAQPAISRQVRGLEVELRQVLLVRNGRGAAPTDAGKRLLEHARGILQQVERARRDVDESKGAAVGKVVVGLPPTFARHLTVPFVRAFRQDYQRASLSIVEGLSSTIQEWLEVGRVDVGLVYNPTASPAIAARIVLGMNASSNGSGAGRAHSAGRRAPRAAHRRRASPARQGRSDSAVVPASVRRSSPRRYASRSCCRPR